MGLAPRRWAGYGSPEGLTNTRAAGVCAAPAMGRATRPRMKIGNVRAAAFTT